MQNENSAKDAQLSEAFIAGRRAGRTPSSPSLNLYPSGTALHEQWRQGWQSSQDELVQLERTAAAARRVA